MKENEQNQQSKINDILSAERVAELEQEKALSIHQLYTELTMKRPYYAKPWDELPSSDWEKRLKAANDERLDRLKQMYVKKILLEVSEYTQEKHMLKYEDAMSMSVDDIDRWYSANSGILEI